MAAPSNRGERFSDYQMSKKTDAELLSELLGISESVVQYRGSLHAFFSGASNRRPNRKCVAAHELVKRWLSQEVTKQEVFANHLSVVEYLKIHFARRDYESFVVMFLDAQNRLIALDEMFQGTLTQTAVYPREIVKAALSYSAASVIFSHNHPSGVPKPSQADEKLTQTLKSALAMMDVRVLDHIIIANSESMSFADMGLL